MHRAGFGQMPKFEISGTEVIAQLGITLPKPAGEAAEFEEEVPGETEVAGWQLGANGRTAAGEPPAVLGEMNGAGPVAGGTIDATAGDGGRTGMKGAVERLQPIGVGGHIGVDEGEEVAGGRLGGEVAGGVGAEGVGMVMSAGLGVKAGNGGAGRVAGGAVDDDCLPIGE